MLGGREWRHAGRARDGPPRDAAKESGFSRLISVLYIVPRASTCLFLASNRITVIKELTVIISTV